MYVTFVCVLVQLHICVLCTSIMIVSASDIVLSQNNGRMPCQLCEHCMNVTSGIASLWQVTAQAYCMCVCVFVCVHVIWPLTPLFLRGQRSYCVHLWRRESLGKRLLYIHVLACNIGYSCTTSLLAINQQRVMCLPKKAAGERVVSKYITEFKDYVESAGTTTWSQVCGDQWHRLFPLSTIHSDT